MLNTFACICWPLICLHLRNINICSGPLPNFKLSDLVLLLLSCWNSLYIMDLNLLSEIWFANILSRSVACLFTLLIISFTVQELFSLMQLHLSIFAFVACGFDVTSKKSLPILKFDFFPYFSKIMTFQRVIHTVY